MARGKSISVKIATPKVIKALESALDKLEKNYLAQEANEAKYNKAQEKYNKEVAKLAITQFAKATNIRVNARSWSNTVNVDFDLPLNSLELPTEPTRDYENIGHHDYREQKRELTNAISILKMTDEEVVNTSTYNAVARYL